MTSFKVINRENYKDWPETTAALSYDCNIDGNNSEWRELVVLAISFISKYFQVDSLELPIFSEGEDLVDLKYLIKDVEFVFSCDATLSTIWMRSESEYLLENIETLLRNEFGRSEV